MSNKSDDPRRLAGDFRLELDPEAIDESIRTLAERLRRLVEQGRYTKVRIKYKGKPVMPDIPLGVLVATEAATFWFAGPLRALVVTLGARAFVDVEFIHDADEKVREGLRHYSAGDVEDAEACYRDALRIKPDDTAALFNLGVLLRVTGRRSEAISSLEKAAADAEHPDAERARAALKKMKRGPRAL